MNGVTGISNNTAGQTSTSTAQKTSRSGKSYSAVMTVTADKAEQAGESRQNTGVKTESVVEEYKRKHPESRSKVDSMVKAGKSVLEKNGADDISRDDMTMEEYKRFITALMDSIPFDVSQRNCTEIWSISEQGWEQMKKDPDYEAWVLGYTVQNRSVHFPAMLSGVSNLCTEKFGASIEQHIGQSVPTGGWGDKSSSDDDDEETWWQKRHKRIKKLLKEQAEAAQAKHRAQQAFVMELYRQEARESSQRMSVFLKQDENNPWKNTAPCDTTSGIMQSAAAAAAVYEQNIIGITPETLI